jgi:ribonuclease BN (tRNA processing enzyme)
MEIARSRTPPLKITFTKSLSDAMEDCGPGLCHSCPMEAAGEINPDLLSMAWKADRHIVQKAMDGQHVVFFYDQNGAPASMIAAMDRASAGRAVEVLTAECIEALKKKYTVKYDHWEETLYVIDRRFDPEKAKALGVHEGPLFGRLTRGEAVTVKGTTITPQMVLSENVKRIKLNNYLPAKTISAILKQAFSK